MAAASSEWTAFGRNYVLIKNLEAQSLWMAIGTGTVAADPTDTALGTESARVALATNDIVAAVWTAEGYYNSGLASGDKVTESGVFDASSGGNLLLRTTFAEQNKEAGMHLTHTIATTLNND